MSHTAFAADETLFSASDFTAALAESKSPIPVFKKTLKAAQETPESYKDLLVRMAGYSDYFNDLGTDLQNEIIRRTMHEGC